MQWSGTPERLKEFTIGEHHNGPDIVTVKRAMPRDFDGLSLTADVDLSKSHALCR
jgi:hypothetical protein